MKKLLMLIFAVLFAASLSGLLAGVAGRPGQSLSENDRITLGTRIHESESGRDEEQRVFNISDIMKRMIPSNIFAALSNGDILGVLVFSVMLGIALGFIKTESSQQIISSLDALFNAFLKIIAWSMYLLPFALFCLMAKQVTGTGLSILLAMTRFVLIYYAVCLIFILGSVLIIIRTMRVPLSRVVMALKAPLVVAFGTFNSYAAMPFAIKGLVRDLGLDRQVTGLVMPLGLTICRPGTLLNLSLGTVFIAQLFSLSLSAHGSWMIVLFGVMLAALAAAGAPSAIEISMLALVLSPLGLPVSVAMILLLAVDPITDPIRTVLNVITNCSIATLTAPSRK